MNKGCDKFSVIILLVIMAGLFFGWVLPKVPYTRRISKAKAEDLKAEYDKATTVTVNGKLVHEEILIRDRTARELTKAGYSLIRNDNNSSTSLLYPDYAK